MKYSYKIIKTIEEVYELRAYIYQTGYMCTDFETSSLRYYDELEYPTIMGVSFQPGSSWILPLGHFDSPFKDNYIKVLNILKPAFEDPSIVKIAWNYKFEYKWLLRYNIMPMGRVYDAMLLKYLLKEDKPHGLKPIVDLFLPDFAGYALPGSNHEKFNWSAVPLEELAKYCGLDTNTTFLLFLNFEPKVMAMGFYPLFRNLLSMIVRVLAKCEFFGFEVNKEYLSSLIIKYKGLIDDNSIKLREHKIVKKYDRKRLRDVKKSMIDTIENEIEDLESKGNTRGVATRKQKIALLVQGSYSTKKERDSMAPLNFGSPKQMADLLYESEYGFELPILERTDSGAPSTGEDTILKLKEYDDSGFLDLLLKSRELEKLNSTYIEGMMQHLSRDSRIHCSYKINGTVTGRISSTAPNMQNIPRTCISRDQEVLTNRGWIKVGTLIPDSIGTEEISGLEALTHTGEYKPITHGVNKGKGEMIEITFSNGHTLTCTEQHRLLCTDGSWHSVRDIIDHELEVEGYELGNN